MNGFKKGGEGANWKAREEKADLAINHMANLYDLNEDTSGEKIDLATGKPIDNSGIGEDLMHLTSIGEPDDESGKDVLPPLEEEDDEAARWLLENDQST